MLGEDGDKMLSEEVKWLAVTHKSFDQGRRGFNDRLAFIGGCYTFLVFAFFYFSFLNRCCTRLALIPLFAKRGTNMEL